jgi:predicted dehydrogenase
VLCLRTDAYYQADRWRGTWEQEGGSVMINQAIHFVDLLNWMTGGIEAVAAAYANLTHGATIETEDTAVAAVRFRNGALGSMSATSSSHLNWDPSFFFYGSAGSLELRDGRPLRVAFNDETQTQRVREDLETCARASSSPSAGKDYYGPSHPTQIADFVAAIRERRSPYIPARAAREAVDLVLGIYRSHREGRWITFPA